MVRSRWLLAALLCGACGSDLAQGPDAPVAPIAQEAYVPIASYLNPALSNETTEDQIVGLLARRDIKWVAYGSLGYTLSVPASQAELARSILRTDARLATFVIDG